MTTAAVSVGWAAGSEADAEHPSKECEAERTQAAQLHGGNNRAPLV